MKCPDDVRDKFSKIMQEKNCDLKNDCFVVEVEEQEHHSLEERKTKSSMDINAFISRRGRGHMGDQNNKQ